MNFSDDEAEDAVAAAEDNDTRQGGSGGGPVSGGWMECSIYQNYSASEVLVQGLAGVVNQGDVEEMVRAQKEMLQRFEKTNEMLTNVNSLSAVRLEKVRVSVTI